MSRKKTKLQKKHFQLKDHKTWFRFTFWNFINHIIMRFHFRQIKIEGKENLPCGPFILVANHSSRWDGPVVQWLLNRKANYMVSPNEMRGMQGRAVRSVGAFPSSSRRELVEFALDRLSSNEPVVVFPEGNIFRDNFLHPFQKGAARIALEAAARNKNVPVVPVAISYANDGFYSVACKVGTPFLPTQADAPLLTEEMHQKVNCLKFNFTEAA